LSDVEILNDKEARVTLKDIVTAIPPGQSAVFYDGDTVIGGGIIKETCNE